jgi:hypothetical protein
MDLTCPLCSSVFAQDRLPLLFVSCGHTFCEVCISHSFNLQNSFGCGLCQVSTTNTSLFVFNKALVQNCQENKKIQSEALHSSLTPHPAGFRCSPSVSHYNPSNQNYASQHLTFGNSENKVDLSFSDIRRALKSNDFVSHYATKSKIQKQREKNINMKQTPRGRSIYNKNFNSATYSQNRSRSITKLRHLRKEFTFGENENAKIDNFAKFSKGSSSKPSKRIIVNKNFKSKCKANYTLPKPSSPNYFDQKLLSARSRRKINNLMKNEPKLGTFYQNNSGGSNSRHNFKTPSYSKTNQFNNVRSNENTNFFSKNYSQSDSGFKNINREFNYFLNLNSQNQVQKNNGPSMDNVRNSKEINDEILNQIEIDSLLNLESGNTMDGYSNICTYPNCQTKTSQSFCSLKCMQSFQQIYLNESDGPKTNSNFFQNLQNGTQNIERANVFPSNLNQNQSNEQELRNIQKSVFGNLKNKNDIVLNFSNGIIIIFGNK